MNELLTIDDCVLAQKLSSVIDAPSLELILEKYQNITWRKLHELITNIRPVDCNKDHEHSLADPTRESYDYDQCPIRPFNANCSHCQHSPLGLDPVEGDDFEGLGARTLLEDTILLLGAADYHVVIPEDLKTALISTGLAMNQIDIGSLYAYQELLGTRENGTQIDPSFDYRASSREEIEAKINAAARPYGQVIMQLRNIVLNGLQEAFPALRTDQAN